MLIKIVGWKQFSNCKHSSQTTFKKMIMLSTYVKKTKFAKDYSGKNLTPIELCKANGKTLRKIFKK